MKLKKHELIIWLTSITAITLSFIIWGQGDFTVLAASLIGATALIYVAKGEPIGQVLTVVFAVFYGFISFTFRYYGEMITYLGMTSPIAIASVIAWYKNPFERGKTQVRVSKLSHIKILILILSDAAVTLIFYFILKYFDTPNLLWSTVSVWTSYAASYLTLMRSPFYALCYAMNDIVLIILWIMAGLTDSSYYPMVICFIIFLINDCYGFINWLHMHRKQKLKDNAKILQNTVEK